MSFIKRLVRIPSILALASVVALSGCQTTEMKITPELVAEPMPVDYRTEISILRLNQLLASNEITNEQRARFLYDRANQYERLGLKSMAKFDYDYALQLKPDFAEAYSSLGVFLTLMRQFDKAYEAFDSANHMQPNYQFAYLSRGIALYYGGRPRLAKQDVDKYIEYQPSDPYRVIWGYIVQYKDDPVKALTELRQKAIKVPDNQWASNIIKLYLEQISEQDFIATIEEPDLTEQQRSMRQCEAYFYLGKLRDMKGDRNNAHYFYKLALATNVYEFIEHKYARLELEINQVN